MRQNLPQEIIDRIEYWVHEINFCSGYIYAYCLDANHAATYHGAEDPTRRRSTLLTLSKRIHDQYQERVWAETVWIIDAGPSASSLQFLTLPRFDLAKRYIRRALEYWGKYGMTAANPANHGYRYGIQRDSKGTSKETFQTWFKRNANELHLAACVKLSSRGVDEFLSWVTGMLYNDWRRKLDQICHLELTELILDFTECYGLDTVYDDWLGINFVVFSDLWPSHLRIPQKGLTIRAPDQEKEEILMREILRQAG
ncbi:MAG: hypothetical protein Q9213_002319 [Squamulea squamosa]